MSYDAGMPWAYRYVREAPLLEDEGRIFLSDDLCVVNNWFFVRGCIEIPVIGTGDSLTWVTWALIGRDEYARILRMWENPERVFERPYKGLLATEIPGYRKTLFLKAWVHTRTAGEHTWIELDRSKNRLSIEQHEGITMARLQEVAEQRLHGRNVSV